MIRVSETGVLIRGTHRDGNPRSLTLTAALELLIAPEIIPRQTNIINFVIQKIV